MRAATIAGPRAITVEEVPRPEVAPDHVLVRIEGCGVCGSNLPVWEGREWFDYPLEPGAPGHEAWGVVEAVGDAVNDLRPGDRVALLSGRAFASFDVAPAAHVVRLPPELDGMPFPGEALGCAVNVVRRSDLSQGETVVVVGIGFLGAAITAFAASEGARVIAISRRPFSLEIARSMGAAETVALDEDVVSRVTELNDGELPGRVIEAVGLQEPLDLASRLTAVRGRLVIAGYHQEGPRSVDMQLWNWRGIDVVNAHERNPLFSVDGMRAAAEAVATGRVDPSPLYTHEFPLEGLGQAFEAMRDRPDGFLKALART